MNNIKQKRACFGTKQLNDKYIGICTCCPFRKECKAKRAEDYKKRCETQRLIQKKRKK